MPFIVTVGTHRRAINALELKLNEERAYLQKVWKDYSEAMKKLQQQNELLESLEKSLEADRSKLAMYTITLNSIGDLIKLHGTPGGLINDNAE